MPKLSKQFHLEVTVEQFLGACSMLELQEVSLLLDGYIQRAERGKYIRDSLHVDEHIIPYSPDFNPMDLKNRNNET